MNPLQVDPPSYLKPHHPAGRRGQRRHRFRRRDARPVEDALQFVGRCAAMLARNSPDS